MQSKKRLGAERNCQQLKFLFTKDGQTTERLTPLTDIIKNIGGTK
jgi:hypothetical protein